MPYNANVFSFIETRLFSRQVQEYLDDDSYREMQKLLMKMPAAGNVIAGTGGVRKLRWQAPGRGKRGGYRVIYFFRNADGII